MEGGLIFSAPKTASALGWISLDLVGFAMIYSQELDLQALEWKPSQNLDLIPFCANAPPPCRL
jgi:hypothetical protein